MIQVITTLTDGTLSSPAPSGYAPGDTGNWSDIGPWWASVIFALVLVPFAWQQILSAIRVVMRHV